MQTEYSRDELLADLQQYADENGERPTVPAFRELDQYASPKTYQERFGSWREALEKAGFNITRYSREELIEAIGSLADELGHPPSRREMDTTDGYPSHDPFEAEFGSWSNSIEAVGYDPTETGPVPGASIGGMNKDDDDR